LVASRVGLLPSQVDVMAPDTSVVLYLRRRALIEGAVEDEQSRGVEGVTVTLFRNTDAGRDIVGSQFTAKSDGRFVFADVPDGTYEVQAALDSHMLAAGNPTAAAVIQDQRDARVHLLFPQGLTISGTVHNRQGMRLADVTVTATEEASGKSPVVASAESGVDGSFQVEHLTEGKYALTAASGTWALRDSRPEAAAGAREVELTLDRLPRLTARVILRSGRQVSTAILSVVQDLGAGHPLQIPHPVHITDGRIDLPWPDRGPSTIQLLVGDLASPAQQISPDGEHDVVLQDLVIDAPMP
jgi:hypothetical protein